MQLYGMLQSGVARKCMIVINNKTHQKSLNLIFLVAEQPPCLNKIHISENFLDKINSMLSL